MNGPSAHAMKQWLSTLSSLPLPSRLIPSVKLFHPFNLLSSFQTTDTAPVLWRHKWTVEIHLLFGGARCSTNQMFSFYHLWSIWRNTIRVLEAHLLPYLINLHIHLALFVPNGSTVIGYQLNLYLKSCAAEKKKSVGVLCKVATP